MNTVNRELLYSTLQEVLDDEVYDVCDVYSREDIEDMMQDIYRKFVHCFSYFGLDHCNIESKLRHVRNARAMKYSIKICNSAAGSSVSVSSYTSTGVSRSLYFAFDVKSDDLYEQVKNLMDMINEAWYACRHNRE